MLTSHGQRLLYIPGRTVHHASRSYRGDGKTDEKDAYVIADQARMRRDLQPLQDWDEIAVDLSDGSWGERALAGAFQIVRGEVRRVAPVRDYVYLNFGADWRRDFTVRIRRQELEARFARSGTDALALAGHRVEVRGFVLEAGGPLIEVSHPEQIEVLP